MDYEQFVIDTELIAMLRQLVTSLEVSTETLALDTIDAVGPEASSMRRTLCEPLPPGALHPTR